MTIQLLSPNSTVHGRYQVVRKIGQGGMGAVYEALDLRLKTRVALKQTTVSDPQYRTIFEREAQLLAALRHKGIPHVSDYFTDVQGQFLVMQYIEGSDLGELLEQQHGPLPVAQVLSWADELLDVLDYLHSRQPPIFHRDIKPSNIKLTSEGTLILLDFGLAKGSAAATVLQTQTAKSVFGYTPGFAPFEQIQGLGTDARSDLYSLAATLYCMLTGTIPPDVLSRIGTVYQGQSDPLKSIHQLNPHVPPAISDALMKTLSINIDERIYNARTLKAIISSAATKAATLPTPHAPQNQATYSLNNPLSKKAVPPVWLWFAVTLPVLALLIGGAILIGSMSNATSSARVEPTAIAQVTISPEVSDTIENEPPTSVLGINPEATVEPAVVPLATSTPVPVITPITPAALETRAFTSTPLIPTSLPVPTADPRDGFPAAEVQAILGNSGATYGVMILDLANPDVPIYVQNEGDIFTAASLIKIPIAVVAYILAGNGEFDLNETLILSSADIVGGTGSIQYAAPGTPYTLRNLVARMIYDSDNTAANMVIRRIGGLDRVNAELGKLGITQTTNQRFLMDLAAIELGRDNRTSPADIAQLMQLIYRDAFPNAEELRVALAQNQDRQKIPALLPPSAVVGNKTGSLPISSGGGAEHDVAVLRTPDGRQYIVAILSKDLFDSSTTIAAISNASSVIYTSLALP